MVETDESFRLNQWGNNFSYCYYTEELKNKRKTVSDVVEEAAQGITIEGTKLGKPCEAEWLAEQLRAVKYFGNMVEADMHTKFPPTISQTCVYLYTKELFLYKLINSVLRNPETITCEQLKTLGPFSWLLCTYLKQSNTRNNLIVYRGATLTDQQRQEYIKREGERLRCLHSLQQARIRNW
ncbi:unnamed protein product [Rotaria sp. Silwood2]|nr:unnamed protein product [Rotaria sp. Silwood2]